LENYGYKVDELPEDAVQWFVTVDSESRWLPSRLWIPLFPCKETSQFDGVN